MRRILIIGSPGAGKSTLSQRLSERLGIPVIHLDREYFGPGWTETEKQAWRRRAGELAAGPEWIMDGNYASTFDIRVPRATDIVWLDVPRWTCLIRVCRRVIRHWGQARPDMGPDCPERFNGPFMRWIWNYPNDMGIRTARMMKTIRPPQRGHIVRKASDLADLERRLMPTAEAA
jgi:adenylate kinase family enzyme